MEILEEKFEKVKKEAKEYYDGLNSVYCPFFWSIYPSWKKEDNENGVIKKVFYSGNLEED